MKELLTIPITHLEKMRLREVQVKCSRSQLLCETEKEQDLNMGLLDARAPVLPATLLF